MGRAPCCDKDNVKRGPWSPEEDRVLKSYIEKYGTGGNWIALPYKAGLRRCGKSCRLRWLNYLRPDIKHGGFTEEEDKIICKLYKTMGSRWSIIAGNLPGRTDNDVKNYWNTKLKKKLAPQVQPKTEKMTTFPTGIAPASIPTSSNSSSGSCKTGSFMMESELNLVISRNLSETSSGHGVAPNIDSVDSIAGNDDGVGFDGLFMDTPLWSTTSDLFDLCGFHQYKQPGLLSNW